jgi:hypothetical protein
MDNRPLREALGRTGRERIAARHRPEFEADGLIRAYETAMAAITSKLPDKGE